MNKRPRSPSLVDSLITLSRASTAELEEVFRGQYESTPLWRAADAMRPLGLHLLAKRVAAEVETDMQEMRKIASDHGGRIEGDLLKWLHDREAGLFWRIAEQQHKSRLNQRIDSFKTLLSCASWTRAACVEKLLEVEVEARDPWITMLRGGPIVRLSWHATLKAGDWDEFADGRSFVHLEMDWDDGDRSVWQECAAAGQTYGENSTLDVREATALVLYTRNPTRGLNQDEAPDLGSTHAEQLNCWMRRGPYFWGLMDQFPATPWVPITRSLLSAAYTLSVDSETDDAFWRPGQGSLWRAVHFTDLRKHGHVPGAIVRWTAFSSASSSRVAAENYGKGAWKEVHRASIAEPANKVHTFCQIDNVRSAVDVTRYTDMLGVPALREVLILPGARFEVVAVHEQPYGVFMHLREVQE